MFQQGLIFSAHLCCTLRKQEPEQGLAFSTWHLRASIRDWF